MSSLVSYRNWADDEATTIVFGSDFDEIAEYPLTALQTRQLSDVARWTGADEADVGRVILDVTFDGFKPIDVIALLGLNFTTANRVAGMTITLYQGATLLEEYAVVDNQDAGAPDRPYNLIAVLPRLDGATPTATRVLISAEWDATEAEYSECGRLWIGDGVFLSEGMDAGWALNLIDTGFVEESDGRQAYEDPKTRVRVMEMPLTGIDTFTAWGYDDEDVVADDLPSINGLQLAKGVTGDVLAVGRTETPVWISRSAIYGRMVNAIKIVHQSGPNWAANMTVMEER